MNRTGFNEKDIILVYGDMIEQSSDASTLYRFPDLIGSNILIKAIDQL